MNNKLKLVVLFVLSFALTILDTSFFSFVMIKEAQIISTYLVLVIFAIKADNRFFEFSTFCAVMFSVFSSLPVWLILVNFCLLPSLFYYFRQKFLPEPSVFSSFLYFVSAAFFFELFLLIYVDQLDAYGATIMGSFVLINAIAGSLIYLLQKHYQKLIRKPEIKL